MEQIVRIVKLTKDAVLPTKAHGSDFAYDVVAVSEQEIAPNVWRYGLGLAFQPLRRFLHSDVSMGISFRPRSSVWKTGMVLSNCVGTIDEGYTGEVSAVFFHVMPDMPRYKVGDRIGQIYFDTANRIEWLEADYLEERDRGDNGYGSSGR